MKLVLTLLVRDEVDIIRQNIEYHLNAGVDFIIITDNGSVDGTADICSKFVDKGVAELIIEPPVDFSQFKYVSQMANMAVVDYNADWVINADADEFFVPKTSNNLKTELSKISSEHSIVSIKRHDFVPIKRQYSSFDPRLFPYRKSISLNLAGKPLPPKVIHRAAANIQVSQGNHTVSGHGLYKKTDSVGIEIFHYPIRSYKQFKTKVANAGSGYAKNKELSKNTGFHKKYWYDLLLKNELKKEFDKHYYGFFKLIKALYNKKVIREPKLRIFKPFINNS